MSNNVGTGVPSTSRRADLARAGRALPQPRKLALIEGADHFFAGRLRELRQMIEEWIEELQSGNCRFTVKLGQGITALASFEGPLSAPFPTAVTV